MKQQVFYIHGGESYQNYDDYLERLRTKGIWDLPDTALVGKWTSTLRADLGADYEVFMPAMPNKQNTHYIEWQIWFERHFEHLRDDVILIGCSLGAMFLMKYLTENTVPFRVKALILMAGPVALPTLDTSYCAEFVIPPTQAAGLAQLVPHIHIWHSTDDFVVPYEHATALAEVLPTAILTTFTDKNHFLVPELPELVSLVKKICSQ